MKTMIRTATIVSVLLFALVSTNCTPTTYVVHDVYRYDDSNDSGHYNQSRYSTTHYGNVNYNPYGTSPRSFELVEAY